MWFLFLQYNVTFRSSQFNSTLNYVYPHENGQKLLISTQIFDKIKRGKKCVMPCSISNINLTLYEPQQHLFFLSWQKLCTQINLYFSVNVGINADEIRNISTINFSKMANAFRLSFNHVTYLIRKIINLLARCQNHTTK